ncbi:MULTISPECIES: hypothetical protein [Pontibacter]|uniref:hypothetical protein n=1 Tax=Pontibacter TaxID=323449 RepID=UPI002025F1C7|nr:MULTISPECIES: hypothetical protein [Pontibacter]
MKLKVLYMNQQQDQLATLHEIRNIMDRSSRFISLSGLSGIAAGVSALLGAAVVKWYLVTHNINYNQTLGRGLTNDNLLFLVAVAAFVFILALCTATYFTARNAKKNSHRVWDSKTERMLVNLFIPIAAGGAFCAILIYHDLLYLVAPVMLIFYGCGLLNASKYTLSDIRYLGLLEIIIGLVASFFVGYGLFAWTLGFGVLHIVYGALVYFKYER